MSVEKELIENGLPARTVGRIEEPEVYRKPNRLNDRVSEYSSDITYEEGDLVLGYNLQELSVDLDQDVVRYADQHGGVHYAFSKNDFDTALVVDPGLVPWTVDNIEGNSFYFNNALIDRYLPSNNPEVIDPVDNISRIWEDAKNVMDPQTEEITVEEAVNGLEPDGREPARAQDIWE